jgi:uncharacterized protein with HEPN domain
MSLIRDLSVVEHILEFRKKISNYHVRFGNCFEKFETDEAYFDLMAHCILQIGELSGTLSDEFKTAHNEIPWREYKLIRNVATHAYGKLSKTTIWDLLAESIPDLQELCQNIMQEHSKVLTDFYNQLEINSQEIEEQEFGMSMQ